MGKADLHIHSSASDGNSAPSDIIALAIRHKLDIIALTDHDSIKGFKEARRAAAGSDIEVLPGVELSAVFTDRECHLLAYCFDPDDAVMVQLLLNHKKARMERAKWILKELAKQGLDVSINEVKAEANGSNIGRPHIAAVLVNKGYVANHKEAFIRYLSSKMLGTIKSNYHTYEEIIKIVKEAGGAVIVAHPGQLYTEKELELFVKAGVDGIEVMHPSHNYELQKKMEDFAEKHNLLITGGSDFHGDNREYQRYFGVVTINTNKARKIIDMTVRRKKLSV